MGISRLYKQGLWKELDISKLPDEKKDQLIDNRKVEYTDEDGDWIIIIPNNIPFDELRDEDIIIMLNQKNAMRRSYE